MKKKYRIDFEQLKRAHCSLGFRKWQLHMSTCRKYKTAPKEKVLPTR